MTNAARADTAPPGRAGFILLTLLTLAALAVLVSLGTWQVNRLAWKEALIARVDQRFTPHPNRCPRRRPGAPSPPRPSSTGPSR